MAKINWIIQEKSNDTVAFNSTMKATLFKAGLAWDEEYAKLISLLTKNGSISDILSRPFNETKMDNFVWSQRLSMSIATNLYQVSK